jgi:hypothetical protein
LVGFGFSCSTGCLHFLFFIGTGLATGKKCRKKEEVD